MEEKNKFKSDFKVDDGVVLGRMALNLFETVVDLVESET
jgi:hypothetical protein